MVLLQCLDIKVVGNKLLLNFKLHIKKSVHRRHVLAGSKVKLANSTHLANSFSNSAETKLKTHTPVLKAKR